jgi:serralysin
LAKARTSAVETTFDSPIHAPVSAPLEPLHEAATFNDTFQWQNSTGLPTHIQNLVGGTERGLRVAPEGTNHQGTVTWQLDSGASITPHKGVITFSFLDSAHTTGMYNRPQEGFTEGYGYSPFTEAQRVAGRTAIHNWDDLIAPTFQEVNGSGAADITMANTTTGPAQAWAYIPYDYADIYTTITGDQSYNAFHRYDKFVSDAWIADPRVNGSNGQLLPGFYGLQTLNHELGHTLGLSHPGNYNFGDDTDGDGVADPINYSTDAEYFQDSNQFTIMSYFDSYETGAQNVDWNTLRFVYPSTPMVDDVYVIQQKYGADMTTRSGDTTYGFNSTSDVWNEAMKFHTGEMATIFTIWDAGGHDKLDLSGYYTPSVIDLREGAYSSAGGWGAYDPSLIGQDPASMTPAQALAIINHNNDLAGLSHRDAPPGQIPDYFYQLYFAGGVVERNADGTAVTDDNGNPVLINEGLSWNEITGTGSQYLMEQNIGIAYGAIIEDAIGGHGNDRFNGNQATNAFTGNDGADTFVIADYSGPVANPRSATGYSNVTDTLHDRITDFSHAQGDQIDLTSFHDVTFADLSYNNLTHDLTIHRHDGGADFHLTLDNVSGVAAGDFIFG